MSLHNPPFYRYLIEDSWSQDAFQQLKDLGSSREFPTIKGTSEDKNRFLVMLIRTQKALHGWENSLIDILKQAKETGVIDTKLLNKKYPPKSIGKGVPAWVTYSGDKIVNSFIDELDTRKITFIGTDLEMSEFVMRFILGQIGHDWEQTIMMIWEILGDGNSLSIPELNKEMKKFDYMNLFA